MKILVARDHFLGETWHAESGLLIVVMEMFVFSG